MPWTPWRRTLSASRKASRIVVRRSTIASSFSFGMTISVSTTSRRRWMPSSAWRMRCVPSNSNGLRDDADGQRADLVLGDLGDDGRGAGAGAAALARGDEDHVRALERLLDLVARLGRRAEPDLRVGAGAEALGQLVADVELDVGVAHLQRLGVGVRGDELDAAQAGVDHAVDRVGAAAADADDLDDGEVAAAALHEDVPSDPRVSVEAFRRTTPCQGQRHGTHGIRSRVNETGVAGKTIVAGSANPRSRRPQRTAGSTARAHA